MTSAWRGGESLGGEGGRGYGQARTEECESSKINEGRNLDAGTARFVGN